MAHWLYFENDDSGIQSLIVELSATEKQVKFALSRALQRTATTLRTLAARQLASDLELRTIYLMRKRLNSLRMRVSGGDGFKLWFGLNAMPVSWFKGTPKSGAGGASFRGQEYTGAFVAKSAFKKRKTIFRRSGSGRLPIEEQLMSIGDRAHVSIEDNIFDKTEAIFWNHFERDLRARVTYGVGNKVGRKH